MKNSTAAKATPIREICGLPLFRADDPGTRPPKPYMEESDSGLTYTLASPPGANLEATIGMLGYTAEGVLVSGYVNVFVEESAGEPAYGGYAYLLMVVSTEDDGGPYGRGGLCHTRDSEKSVKFNGPVAEIEADMDAEALPLFHAAIKVWKDQIGLLSDEVRAPGVSDRGLLQPWADPDPDPVPRMPSPEPIPAPVEAAE